MIQTRPLARRATLTCLLAAVSFGPMGCESDSYLDPTLVGRWERTPVSMPILDRLDLRRNVTTEDVELSPVRPEDLIPDRQEYVIGSGDFITVSIFELINVGVTDTQNREIDETGSIRLPVVGKVQAAGLSPSQLEERIIDILAQKDIMDDATVSVVVQQSRQNLYSIIGDPAVGSTRFGTYLIPQPDFRLLEAIALAGGVTGRTKTILIFRSTALTPEVAGEAPPDPAGPGGSAPAPRDGGELVDDILDGSLDPAANDPAAEAPAAPDERPAPPPGVEAGLDASPANSSNWVYLNNEYVRVQGGSANRGTAEDAPEGGELEGLIAQRIIEVPYDRLIDGAMQFNVVIRPGDVIRIPDQTAGFVYMMGQTNRPGAYTVPRRPRPHPQTTHRLLRRPQRPGQPRTHRPGPTHRAEPGTDRPPQPRRHLPRQRAGHLHQGRRHHQHRVQRPGRPPRGHPQRLPLYLRLRLRPRPQLRQRRLRRQQPLRPQLNPPPPAPHEATRLARVALCYPPSLAWSRSPRDHASGG